MQGWKKMLKIFSIVQNKTEYYIFFLPGLTNLNNCTIEKCIPVYLVISGVAPLMFSGLSWKGKGVIETCGRLVCGCFGFFFSVVWLICGKNCYAHPSLKSNYHKPNCKSKNNLRPDLFGKSF
jgi:hypothetical protein